MSNTHPLSGTRERILNAAVKEFAANGFRVTTINNIAHSAGLNEVTVYRYFPKKQQLYWEALDFELRSLEVFDELLEVLNRCRTPKEVVVGLGETVLGATQKNSDILRLLYFTILELEDEKRQLIRIHFRPFLQKLTGRILSWIQSGEIRAVDPESAANLIVGTIVSHLAMQSLLDPGSDSEYSLERVAASCADICVRGLQPGPVPLQSH